MVDYCKHGYSKAQLKARLCVDCDRAKYEATLTTLRAQLAEATRRAEAARAILDKWCLPSLCVAGCKCAACRIRATLDPKGGK